MADGDLCRRQTHTSGPFTGPKANFITGPAYVTDVDPERPSWLAFDLKEDGSLAPGRVFQDGTAWKAPGYGGPDGLAVDKEGNLFAPRPGGVNIFAPDGALLGAIEIGSPTSNCAWAKTVWLYVTAGTAIHRIELTTKGVGF